MIRLGIVDCDTSHVVAFTQRLNHKGIAEDQWVDDAQIVAAVPGVSQIYPDRLPGFVQQLRDLGVEILSDPTELLGKVDAVLVESNEGGVHRSRALPFLEAGIPVFVDKPFATTTADARRLVEVAQASGASLLSASALRFAPEIQEIQSRGAELGPILGADTCTPCSLNARNPGLFHYGVHGVEMLYALMGPGCEAVRTIWQEGTEVVIGRWADGRLGTVRGTRMGVYAFAFTVFAEKGVVQRTVDGRYFYRELGKQIVETLSKRVWPVAPAELVEVVAFQEAALHSQQNGGVEVLLSSLV
ncbi:MAG TPA: Gfo/Idh/MocA family oxidoreductase [Chloroflexota bacterium]|nr:Gfo/Idh/MocA family oxidoreductase [Chloroflexota bacterium]